MGVVSRGLVRDWLRFVRVSLLKGYTKSGGGRRRGGGGQLVAGCYDPLLEGITMGGSGRGGRWGGGLTVRREEALSLKRNRIDVAKSTAPERGEGEGGGEDSRVRVRE